MEIKFVWREEMPNILLIEVPEGVNIKECEHLLGLPAPIHTNEYIKQNWIVYKDEKYLQNLNGTIIYV